MDRAPGLSVRLKLTLSYAGFVMLAGALLLGAVWMFLLRHVPRGETVIVHGSHVFVSPSRGGLLRDFGPAAAIVLACLLVFGLLGGWLLAGRMLSPLARITDAARMAAGGSLSHRIRLPGRDDEFRELADAFDAMLAQLEAHVAEQQRFAANASHELRTPLAITQTLLEVARRDPSRGDDELVERLLFVNTRAIDLTEALLVLSRADQRSFTPERVDLSLLAEEATEALLPLAENRGVTMETSGQLAPTMGSAALLMQLATNLVHNAIVHNLADEGTVWVTTGVRGARCGPDGREHRRDVDPTADFDAGRAVSARIDAHSYRPLRESVSAWPSSRASPKRTTGLLPWRPVPPVGSAPELRLPALIQRQRSAREGDVTIRDIPEVRHEARCRECSSLCTRRCCSG